MAFQFVIVLMAFLTSASVGFLLLSMLMSSGAGGGSVGSSGWGGSGLHGSA